MGVHLLVLPFKMGIYRKRNVHCIGSSLKSLWVWESCFVADTHAMKSLWVWEACFVADTHVMKSLWVWEAYSIAIPKSWKPEGITRKLYIPKCLPWVFCILKSFQKPVARSWGKDKQTLSSRRYLARVLSSLMYRYGLRPKRKRVCGS